jgi:hypothetical protein
MAAKDESAISGPLRFWPVRRRLFQSTCASQRDSSSASARHSCGSTTGGSAAATCAAFASKMSSPPDERVRVGHLGVLRQRAEPRGQMSSATPIQRVEEGASRERRSCPRGIGECGLRGA